ncbi:hypothetical protein [Asticcacaulis excentricus]|uniref:Uncharacterized protein n=1 Tax=Asticcacaulis excentricus (strain ATCC 15261 / DSM 4724 / KCTC 12464 / NCIMB 9791 / VKM B-1370 / CB 48) TaxID=573065 RepID=E8RMZ3_ASTEC|nr:hypothetical protein [Asticcacaulis excentricus]ADU11756.1 hypothetical protein Astex_0052 [Asticcacaulis excentricus CB 48]
MQKKVFMTVAVVALMGAGIAQANDVVTLTKPPVFKTRTDTATSEIPSAYKPKPKAKTSDFEPLRGPWRVTKSLKDKGKEPVDEDGNTYACVDKDCKVSRKVDEKRD